MSIMYEEIKSTPQLLVKTIAENTDRVRKLAAEINARPFGPIYIASRGSSANAGCYFSYMCETHAGLPAYNLRPSVLTLFNGALRLDKGTLLAISQGGRGSDIKCLVDHAKASGGLTAAICNEEDSPTAQSVDHFLPMCLNKEQAMAATKTFTAEMLLSGMLAYALAGKDISEFDAVPELFAKTLELEEQIEALSAEYTGTRSCFVLGRSNNLAVARELCCKLQETCFINAIPFSQAEFLHGPMALIENGSQVVFFHRDDETGAFSEELIEKLEANGALVTVFTDSEKFACGRKRTLLIPKADAALSPFAFTAAIQLFSCFLSARKGLDPDHSRNLNKYTVTL